MDEGIEENEQVEKIDHFTQQLINSGYQWGQVREVIVCSLKGFLKKGPLGVLSLRYIHQAKSLL